MDLVIRALNFKSIEALEAFASEQFQKRFGRYSFISAGSLYLTKDASELLAYNVKLQLSLKKGGDVFAEASADRYEKALLKSMHKINRQLDRYKQAHYSSMR